MASCILFHGPGARQAALAEVPSLGVLVAPPYGDEGLKTAEAREVVSSLLSPPTGMEAGVVVVGPMDLAWPKASDVLLKRLEEFHSDVVTPILWANDLGGVSPTIRSRCLDRWAPSVEEDDDDDDVVMAAWELVEAVTLGETYLVGKALFKVKGKETALLNAIAAVLSTDMDDPVKRALWDRLRRVALWRNPTQIEVAAALVGG